jgi:F0F1-type ATP synthase assembly protein I
VVISKTQYPLELMRQIGATGLMAGTIAFFVAGILRSWWLGSSLILGVLLWVLPSCYFANKLFRYIGKVSSASLLRIFYKAEIIKLLLSGFFFVMIIKLLSVNIPALVIGYFEAQLIFWVRLMIRN